MIPASVNLDDAYRGDTYGQKTYTLTNDDLSPVNLTGASILIQFKEDENGVVVKEFTIGSGLTLTNPTGGVFTWNAWTCDINAGTYYYDIQITISGIINTYIRGKIIVKNDISR